MTRALVLLLVLAGCERVDDHPAAPAPVAHAPKAAAPPAQNSPATPVAQDSPPAPAAALVVPARPRLTTSRAEPPRRRHARALSEDELPTPPSDEPTAYRAWHAALDPAMRAQVDAFCRREGWNYHPSCGGIGPYHIPIPPSLTMGSKDGVSAEARHAQWYASLTAPQRRYYVYWCRDHTDEGKIGYSELCGGTPLVVQLDLATPIEIVAHGVNAARTPWLVLDRDGDGMITDDELFGDATPLPDGSLAENGFAALAPYDANHDGVIDARDPVFAQLALWNGASLAPLAAWVTRIELANQREPRCTRFGCEGERSALITTAGTRGAVVDVYLRR